jgi:hypothetical protein
MHAGSIAKPERSGKNGDAYRRVQLKNNGAV